MQAPGGEAAALEGATRRGAWRKVIDGGPRHAVGRPKNDHGEWGIGLRQEDHARLGDAT
jgi:hypothetical protein